jgi:hypothetical protein
MVGSIECNASNATAGICNPTQGSVSLVTGQVEYTDYGYIVAAWSAYLYVALALHLDAEWDFR